jgi:hypothetical protein
VLVSGSPRWPLQALTAVMSDYYRSGLPSRWHVADRWLASANVIAEIGRALSVLPAWQVFALAAPPLTCKYLGSRSAARSDYEAYCAVHVLWHVLASAVCVVVEAAYLETSGLPVG